MAGVNPETSWNRRAWESASEKHVREYDDLLAQARNRSSLVPLELDLLGPVLASSPAVVHLQSGHGLDDVALVGAGARGRGPWWVSTSARSRRRPRGVVPGNSGWTAGTWSPNCPGLPCATGAPTWSTRARAR
ncbi:hypothetical protein GCM10018963_65410 [Saccharothrix longispora]